MEELRLLEGFLPLTSMIMESIDYEKKPSIQEAKEVQTRSSRKASRRSFAHAASSDEDFEYFDEDQDEGDLSKLSPNSQRQARRWVDTTRHPFLLFYWIHMLHAGYMYKSVDIIDLQASNK